VQENQDLEEQMSVIFNKYRGHDEKVQGMSIQGFYDLLRDAMLIQTSQVKTINDL
jgi:hypothetical protein